MCVSNMFQQVFAVGTANITLKTKQKQQTKTNMGQMIHHTSYINLFRSCSRLCNTVVRTCIINMRWFNVLLYSPDGPMKVAYIILAAPNQGDFCTIYISVQFALLLPPCFGTAAEWLLPEVRRSHARRDGCIFVRRAVVGSNQQPIADCTYVCVERHISVFCMSTLDNGL